MAENPFDERYVAGLNAKIEHLAPSPETMKLLYKIEKGISTIDKRLAVVETLQEASSKTADDTLAQARKTNGRVKSLEMWRSAMAGAIGIISFLGLPNILQTLTSNV